MEWLHSLLCWFVAILIPPSNYNISGVRIIRLIPTGIVSATSKTNTPLSEADRLKGCKLGMDSHAEITCYGRHARITHIHEGMVSNVSPFHDSYQPLRDVKFANACFAYDGHDGQTYILHHYYGLDFTNSMEDSILCTNQTRAAGVIVDDVPKCFDTTGTSKQSMIFPRKDITFPLLLHNAIAYLPVRYPTDEDMNQGIDVDISDNFPWDPTLFNNKFNLDIAKVILDPNSDLYYDFLDTNEPSHVDTWNRAINISAIRHHTRQDMTAEMLADLWHISVANAARTLQCVDIDRIRHIKGRIHRRFKTKMHQRRYKQLSGYLAHFASDTFKSNVVSLRGNKYIQLFCNRGNFCTAYPMKNKNDAFHTLDRFLHEIGVPSELLTDGALELVMGEWGKICRKNHIYQVTTEPHSPWQNPAEKNGGLIKRKVKHLMRESNTPIVLWDYCWEYAAAIRSFVAVDNVYLDDVSPFAKVHGFTPNITEYTMFRWYDWVEYHDPNSPENSRIGRWLGPAHNIGQGLAHYVLSSDGKVVARSTVIPISSNQRATSAMQERMHRFTANVEALIGDFSQSTLNKSEVKDDDPFKHLFEEDSLDSEDITAHETDDLGDPLQYPDIDSEQAFMENDDALVGLKVPIAKGNGEVLEGTVMQRKRNHDGSLVGRYDPNVIHDTRMYEVYFPDGSYQDYSTNVLIENLHSHIDDDGVTSTILKGITDYKIEADAIPKTNGTYVDKHGIEKKIITTKGWKIQVEWADGTCSWVPLPVVKESNPLELAQFAKSRNIHEQPAFAWWVPHVLKKSERIVKSATHRAVRKKIKFGVVVPDTYEEAIEIDTKNGNKLWSDAIEKELKNVRIAFKPLEEGERPPAGSKHIPYHLVFDVKFDLTRKARLVAGGHRNKSVPNHATYSSVASRDSVRLAFLLAALNDLSILSADIGNAFLNAPPRERCHTTLGPELFGKDYEGKTAIIVRALYGLKTASAAWRHHFSTFIREQLKFEPTYADPDVYRKPMVKQDGFKYYAYLVVYVDDVLCIDVNPKLTMDSIQTLFRLKDGVEKPNMYLGTDTREWTVIDKDGLELPCWGIGSESYIKEAIRTAESNFSKLGFSYSSSRREGRNTPFKNPNYRPELDDTEFCNDDQHHLYQNLIGILRWTCELNRIDILHETSLLSQYLACPRVGHLQEAINIFYYLKYHTKSWMVMDPRRFDIEWIPRRPNDHHPKVRAQAMKEIYPDACDDVPHNAPEPRGNTVDITAFVDADHAGNQVTRRSHTGIIIFVNMAPIVWFSKRQNTVETSTFGSEYIALKTAVELIEGLVYKLRMFGVPIEGEARILCDNESVVNSSSYPEASLKKKHCSVAYHKVREAVAAGKALIYFENTDSNLADLLTKPLSASKRKPFVHALLS